MPLHTHHIHRRSSLNSKFTDSMARVKKLSLDLQVADRRPRRPDQILLEEQKMRQRLSSQIRAMVRITGEMDTGAQRLTARVKFSHTSFLSFGLAQISRESPYLHSS
jgi:hypothetical protein